MFWIAVTAYCDSLRMNYPVDKLFCIVFQRHIKKSINLIKLTKCFAQINYHLKCRGFFAIVWH